jgi:PBP1b-binding outer membrane lipoprotein LpoB
MNRLLILTLLLAGCSTSVPVKRTFPAAPQELMQECPDLKTVAEGTTKLSEVLTVVSENYGQYKECQIKVDLWVNWYERQKKIFNEVK